MSILAFILNVPYTIVGFLIAIISVPVRVAINIHPLAVVIKVWKLWWCFGYMKNARALAVGNVVLLGPAIEDKDLEHELIHVEQHQARPLIQPLLYYIELLRKGYRNNKYEIEAYQRAGNVYKGK